MIYAFAALLLFQFVGEVMASALQVPLPGPLTGMLLIACVVGVLVTLSVTALTLQWLLRKQPGACLDPQAVAEVEAACASTGTGTEQQP